MDQSNVISRIEVLINETKNEMEHALKEDDLDLYQKLIGYLEGLKHSKELLEEPNWRQQITQKTVEVLQEYRDAFSFAK